MFCVKMVNFIRWFDIKQQKFMKLAPPSGTHMQSLLLQAKKFFWQLIYDCIV